MGLALLCPDAQSLPLAGTDAKAQPLAGNAASHIRIRQLVQPTSSASGARISGRFKSELIEDESYFWTVSRYIHLNPVRGKRPLADHPRDWPWSSYPGYDRRRRRVGWVAYEALHSAWRGESGGNDPEAAYRRFVEQGLARAPANPFQSAAPGWLLGSETFIERMRSLLSEPRNQDEVPAARQLASLDAAIVLAEVARYYGVDQDCFQVRRSGLLGRDLAAWLVRHHSSATLRELTEGDVL